MNLLGGANVRKCFRVLCESPFLHDKALSRLTAQARLERLACALYDLQHVPGFAERLNDFQLGRIEDAYGEMNAGAQLHRAGVLRRFVVPCGRRRADFDFELSVADTDIACEAKTKLSRTDLSPQTILDALEHARDQLPLDRPSVIWLNVPSHWIASGVKDMNLSAALAQFQRNAGSVFAITVAYEVFDGLMIGALNDLLRVDLSLKISPLFESYASTVLDSVTLGTQVESLVSSAA